MLSFDSHAVVKNLIAQGLKESVAEGIVNAITASRDSDISKLVSREQFILMEKDVESLKNNVATKTDLVEVRNELKADITEVRNELKADITEVRNELKAEIAQVRNEVTLSIEKLKIQLVMWLAGLFVASTSIILGLMPYLLK